MNYQTNKNYRSMKLSRVVKYAPAIFLAGAMSYAMFSGFKEG